MKWALLVSIAALASGCNADDAPAASRLKHVGCDAGSGCILDMTVTGICAQDRAQLCFCPPEAGIPSSDCQDNVVKPYLPYSKAFCCP